MLPHLSELQNSSMATKLSRSLYEGQSLDIHSHVLCVCVCELKLVAVRIFWVVFVFIRTIIQPVVLCGSEHAEGSRRVPVDYGGFGIWPNILLQISRIFLKIMPTEYMFRPASD